MPAEPVHTLHASTDTSGATVCPVVGCINARGDVCDAKPRCGNLAAPTEPRCAYCYDGARTPNADGGCPACGGAGYAY